MQTQGRDVRVNAVVVNTRPYGEMHKALTLLSQSDGLIDAVLFGGRKGKKTALASLFSFGSFQLYYNPVKKTYSVSDMEAEFTAFNIFHNLNATYTANFLCETAAKISADDYERTYELLSETLKLLEDNVESYRKAVIDFSWKAICLSGISTDLKTCPSCEKTLNEKEEMFFSFDTGTPVCSSCAQGTDLILSPGCRKYLQYTMNMDIKNAFKVEIYPSTEQKLRNFLIPWLSYFCQNSLKTLKSGLI